MLQKMRGFTNSRFTQILLGGLALSFMLWGIGDVLRGGGPDTSVVKVGDVKIPPDEFERELRNYERQIGEQEGHQLSGDEVRAQGLVNRALQGVIDNAALDQAASNYDLVATTPQITAQIRSMRVFHGPLGSFDKMTFDRVLAQNNMTEDQFISLLRQDIVRNQLVGTAGGVVHVPAGYARLFFSYLSETRAAQFIQVSAAALPPIASPTDAQLQAYVKAHSDEFSTPEYRDVTYLSVGPEDLGGQIKVSDDQIRQRYEQLKDQFQVPEKRVVEQIVFPDQASAAAARAKITAGMTFDDLAKSLGKSQSDIALGTIQEADLGPQRGPATFALADGGVTQPVKFTFGWTILHVTKIVPGSSKTLNDVKDVLRKQIFNELSEAKITDISNAFEDARAGGASFTDAAMREGMRVVHVPAVDADGLAPDGSKANLPAAPDFKAQLARAEVGDEGDPFQTADGHAYAIRVNGVTPPKLKPLDAVRAQAAADWMSERRREKFMILAAQMTARANADHGLEKAAEMAHAPVQSTGGLTRQSSSAALSPALVAKIFAATPGSAVSALSPQGDGFTLAFVTGVSHPNLPNQNPLVQRVGSEIGETVGSDIAASLSQAWRTKLGVTINQSQVDRVAGSS